MTHAELSQKIDTLIDRFEDRLTDLEDKVEKLDKDIRGNGDLGMKHRVSKLEDFATEIKWGVRIVVVLVIGEIAARVAGII
jgi:archaellum component FlaC